MANTTETATFNVKSNVGEVGKDAASAAGEFRVMGVSLNSVKTGFVSLARTAKASFATIKAGIMSTGIGALVIAVVSLISYFKNTKRGADLLKQGMAGLGAVVDVLTDLFSRVGETIFKAFSNPKKAISDLWEALKKNLMNRVEGFVMGFKALGKVIESVFTLDMEGLKEGTKEYAQALTQVATGMDEVQQKNFANSIKNITTEIKEEVKAMAALEKRIQALRDADNEFMIQKAQTRQEIERARLTAEDETKSAEERLKNLKKALELEEKTTQRELELARERMRIQEEQMALSENLAEDEAELARLKTAVIETETASLKMKRRVVTEVNALEREIQAEAKARAKEKQDIIDAEFAAMVKANEEWNKEQEAKYKKEVELAKKAADEKIKIEEAVENAKKDLANKAFGAAAALAGENAGLSKGIAAAQVIYSTQQAIMAALAATSIDDKLLPYQVRLGNALAAGAMGVAALSKIASTDPTEGGGSMGATGGSDTPAPQMMSGAFDMTGGIAPDPVRAFVVTDEMTNSQDQLANIRRRATI
tara:strand:- start:3676 stop:5289 length:1614 start_codon:yes stop_codon:yes gene_type:complete